MIDLEREAARIAEREGWPWVTLGPEARRWYAWRAFRLHAGDFG